jgi:hypothetical protein
MDLNSVSASGERQIFPEHTKRTWYCVDALVSSPIGFPILARADCAFALDNARGRPR